MDTKDLKDKEEPAITGLLVKAIRDAIDGKERLTWAARYAVHDDLPINDGPKEGKKRPRVDIEVESTQPVPHPRFQFEAKLLHRSDSVAEYVGPRGLGCFLSGQYASGHDDAGMLGYVQNGGVPDWVDKICGKLESDRAKYNLSPRGACWKERPAVPGLEFSYQSTHMRTGKSIDIHHTFLVCF
jgi:hypothetical protein